MIAHDQRDSAQLLWKDQSADDDEGLPDLVDRQACELWLLANGDAIDRISYGEAVKCSFRFRFLGLPQDEAYSSDVADGRRAHEIEDFSGLRPSSWRISQFCSQRLRF